MTEDYKAPYPLIACALVNRPQMKRVGRGERGRVRQRTQIKWEERKRQGRKRDERKREERKWVEIEREERRQTEKDNAALQYKRAI